MSPRQVIQESGIIAQWLEQAPYKCQVVSSNLTCPAKENYE